MKITGRTRFFPVQLRVTSSCIRRTGHSIREELAAAFGPNTKAIILNTPNNPTGKVFARAELEQIRDLCVEHNAYAITDEIYEHMLYDGARHISMVTLEGMRDRTITINALSKTYSVTGWRVGWAIASSDVTSAIRKVHDFLTVGAAAPLQEAGAIALQFPQEYYATLAAEYTQRRERLLAILTSAGFHCFKPSGAYYIMTDIAAFGFPDDVTFAKYLVTEIGVAAVPGSSFYRNPGRRPHPSPLHILQDRENIPGRGRAPRQTKASQPKPVACSFSRLSQVFLCALCVKSLIFG